MVATQTALGMIGAVTAHRLTNQIPALNRDPQVDAAIKAGLGLAVVLASVWVKEPLAKTALIAVGVGVGSAAVFRFIPALQG